MMLTDQEKSLLTFDDVDVSELRNIDTLKQMVEDPKCGILRAQRIKRQIRALENSANLTQSLLANMRQPPERP